MEIKIVLAKNDFEKLNEDMMNMVQAIKNGETDYKAIFSLLKYHRIDIKED